MENELIVRDEKALALVTENNIGDLIKPLSNEVFLLDTYIAGTTCIKEDGIIENLKEGDKLALQRRSSEFDENAILVLDTAGQRLGYIPEKDDPILARLMDAGKCLSAKITDVEPDEEIPNVSIDVMMEDF